MVCMAEHTVWRTHHQTCKRRENRPAQQYRIRSEFYQLSHSMGHGCASNWVIVSSLLSYPVKSRARQSVSACHKYTFKADDDKELIADMPTLTATSGTGRCKKNKHILRKSERRREIISYAVIFSIAYLMYDRTKLFNIRFKGVTTACTIFYF